MTATTPLGLPYPEVTDRVADGWDAIRDLAVAADALLAARATIASLNAINTALDARLDVLEAAVTDTGWIALTLGAGWSNYGGGFSSANYRRKNGIVYLRGLVKNNDVTTGAGLTVATLPPGYRPANTNIFSLVASQASGHAIRADLAPTGALTVDAAAVNGSFQVPYLSLAGLIFPADA